MKVKLVTSPREQDQVFRLRYNIYIDELHRFQKYCDHVNKTIQEPLDETALLYAVFDENNEIIATCRANYGRDNNLDYYPELYNMHSVGKNHPKHTSILTKLMIHKDYRCSLITIKSLFFKMYEYGLRDNIIYNYMDVYPDHVKFYTKLGYQKIGDIHHPEYGSVCLMRLKLDDLQYLRSIRSPLYAVYNQHLKEISSLCSHA